MCLMNDDRCLRTKTNTPPDVLPCSDSFVDLKEKRHNHRTSHATVLNPRNVSDKEKISKERKKHTTSFKSSFCKQPSQFHAHTLRLPHVMPLPVGCTPSGPWPPP